MGASLPISMGWVGRKGFGGGSSCHPQVFIFDTKHVFSAPSQPPNFLRAGTKDSKCPWSWEGRLGDIKPVLSQFQAGEDGFNKTPGLTSHQHQPSPGLRVWGLVIWGTVLHSSPLFYFPKMDLFFFLRVPENGELFL